MDTRYAVSLQEENNRSGGGNKKHKNQLKYFYRKQNTTMKRLLIILFCLPLLFACQKDELFEEGQEIVLKFSVDVGNLQSATRAFD